MYYANITVSNKPPGGLRTSALIDTGFSGGLWIARHVAEELGATFVRPVRYPRTADGRVIRGSATILKVMLDQSGHGGTTLVFCPTQDPDEFLIGVYFLAQVGASILIGEVAYKPTKAARPNRGTQIDLGDWVLPTNRPTTPWW